MRSLTSKRILKKTPQEVKTKVSNYAKELINMKTPQEIKAEELICKMLGCSPTRQDGISAIDTIQAKQCAKIAVERTISVLKELDEYEHVPSHVFDEEQEVLNCLNRM